MCRKVWQGQVVELEGKLESWSKWVGAGEQMGSV